MESQKEIPVDLVETTYGDGAEELDRIDDFEHMNTQLYTSLLHLTEDEANDLVSNS